MPVEPKPRSAGGLLGSASEGPGVWDESMGWPGLGSLAEAWCGTRLTGHVPPLVGGLGD